MFAQRLIWSIVPLNDILCKSLVKAIKIHNELYVINNSKTNCVSFTSILLCEVKTVSDNSKSNAIFLRSKFK